MKRILIPILTGSLLISCTKQKPDWDQVSCKHVQTYQRAYADSSFAIPLTDPVMIWPQEGNTTDLLCGEELTKDTVAYWSPLLCSTVDGTKYRIYIYSEYQN